MLEIILRRIGALAALTILVAPAKAQDMSSMLAVETVAERRVLNPLTARIEFTSATQLGLGDEIFYTVKVRNITDAPLRDVVVVKEMPRNALYVADSAVGPAAIVNFSVDGGLSFAAASDLSVTENLGLAHSAQPRDYTHIRWQLRHSLAPGATALLRFRGTFH